MKTDNARTIRSNRVWLEESACDLEEFRAIVERTTDLSDYPYASDIKSKVLIYDSAAVRKPHCPYFHWRGESETLEAVSKPRIVKFAPRLIL